MKVELIYDADCPNVAQTRSLLIRAFTKTGVSARWREWDRAAPDSPEYARHYASPTILVDGSDVAGLAPHAGAPACRVYAHGQGTLSRIPPIDVVCAALLDASSGKKARTRWQKGVAVFPAVGVALLPKLTCPACWPAYAGLLSALGLGFLNYTPYLLPLTALFLALTLATLAYRARARRGFGPLILGGFAAMTVLIGKFSLDSDSALYAGVALLVGASLWNAWPKTAPGPCPACVPADPGSINEHLPEGARSK